MKDKKAEPIFEPFSIEIKIETKRELEAFWCLFNSNQLSLTDFVNAHISGEDIDKFTEMDRTAINKIGSNWHQLNNKLKGY